MEGQVEVEGMAAVCTVELSPAEKSLVVEAEADVAAAARASFEASEVAEIEAKQVCEKETE